MKTTKVIWKLITAIPFTYFINLLMWLGLALLDLLPGYMLKLFFDWLTDSRPLTWGIYSIVGMVFIFAGVGSIFLRGGMILDSRTRFVHSALLRRNLLQNILRRPGAKATAVSTGEAISTFRDDAQILEDAADWVLDTVAVLGFAVFAIGILLTINVRLTLVTVLPLFAVLFVTQMASNRIKRYRRASREATEKVTGTLNEILDSVQAIQLANAEEHVQGHFQRLNDDRRYLMVRDKLLSQVLNSIYANSSALGTSLVLILAAGAIRDGSFSLGDFALFIQYITLLAIYTTEFGTFLAQFKQASVSFSRMVKFLSATAPENMTQSEIETSILAHTPIFIDDELPPLDSSTPDRTDSLDLLELRGLSYRHESSNGKNGSLAGIEDVSFQLKKGSFTVITGRIGSGKTTLIQALLGLLPLDGGEVWWNGRYIPNPADFFVPPRTAYTPQVPHLFSDSLRENLLMGLPHSDESINQAIHQAVFEQDVADMPNGLETVVGPNGVRLSGGQMQRTAAARMFIRQPDLLVFDDLSSALDIKTETKLWERLIEMGSAEFGMGNDSALSTPHSPFTCLVVSHRRPALQRADQIVVMGNGRVLDIGTLDELLERCEEMQWLWQGE